MSAICGHCVAKNGGKIILLLYFWSYLLYTSFEGFLEKVFVSTEKSIFPLYNMHIIVIVAGEIRENFSLLDNNVLNVSAHLHLYQIKLYQYAALPEYNSTIIHLYQNKTLP